MTPRDIPADPAPRRPGRRRAPALAALLATACTVLAVQAQPSPLKDGNLTLGGCDAPGVFRTFAAKPGDTVAMSYDVIGGGNVFVDLSPNTNCGGASPTLSCALPSQALSIQAPPPLDAGLKSPAKVTVSTPGALVGGDVDGKDYRWRTVGALASDPNITCEQGYRFHVTSNGGGWGDPHLTTVDGVQYDFQSAGEFTALRQSGLEIQTRQSPVPTASVPITNAYTGITHCVAVYTAVAGRFGSTRFSLQPGLAAGEVNPERMQLRVNGQLVTLGDQRIELRKRPSDDQAGGTPGPVRGVFEGYIQRGANGVVEFTDTSGTQLVVTPQFWAAQNLWYLNINVYQTSAVLGTMGRIATGSWLPALPDGSSPGARPPAEDERYQQLYVKFADAWRVTDTTSLFDYAQGQGTAAFTLADWPRNRPTSCGLPNQTSAPGTDAAAAAQACAAVTDPVRRANCEFDVAITGHLGFGKSYELMQAFTPIGTGWINVNPDIGAGGGTTPPAPWWKAWWWLILLLLLLAVLLAWLLRRRSGP